jgi:hypothetical protein
MTDDPILHDLDLSRPTRELVIDVATRLLARGEKPAVGNVRAILGKGSNLTIQSALNDWWKDLGTRINALYKHPTLPDALATAAMELWAVALREADLSSEKYRVEADSQVVKAEERAREAEEQLKRSEEGRQMALGELDSANATIVGLERTLAAEVSHKGALAKQVDELALQVKEARLEVDAARREASEEVSRIRGEASIEVEHARSSADEEIGRARKEFHDQLVLAQERFEAVEKRMMMEIDRERQNSASVRDAAAKEIKRIRDSAEMDIAILRQQNGKLSVQNGEFSTRLSKLEGQIEEIARQRDNLFTQLSAALSSKGAAQGGDAKTEGGDLGATAGDS